MRSAAAHRADGAPLPLGATSTRTRSVHHCPLLSLEQRSRDQRFSQRQTVVESRTITQAFTWNDLGLIASVGYPDDNQLDNATQEPVRTVSYTYANGFLTAIPSFATSISYHPNTMVNRIAHANAVSVDHTIDPDNMRRPRQIALSNANGSWTYGNYAYDGAGNIKAIGSDTYVYDKVSRLTSGSFATASCGAKSQTASYNPFGYMTSTTTTDWGTQTFTEAASGLYNRISPGTSNYDAAGNMLSWSTYSYTWNRLNQMLTAVSGASHTFFYTAGGERVSDRIGTSKTLTIRGLSDKVLRVYSYNGSTWSWSKDYVYRDGQLLATVEPPFGSQVVKHMHLDYLGSPRRVTDAGRNIVATHDYYAFGMEACGTADNERMKFTGHERDLQGTTSQTDDIDYMHARSYNPNLARFLSVDHRQGGSARPQALDLFAYVRNSPMNAVDPKGLWPHDFNGQREFVDPHDTCTEGGPLCHDFIGGTPDQRKRAYELQEELRRSLTPEVKSWFLDQFGVDLNVELTPGHGITFDLTRSMPKPGVLGYYLDGRGWLNLGFDLFGGGGRLFMAGLIHESAHWGLDARSFWKDLGHGFDVGLDPQTTAIRNRTLSSFPLNVAFEASSDSKEGHAAEILQFGDILTLLLTRP
jgi:RHS repeat-associated protein